MDLSPAVGHVRECPHSGTRYLYQNGVEFRQKVIGAGLNLFWGHLHYFSGGIWTFPPLSDTYASAPIAERAILLVVSSFACGEQMLQKYHVQKYSLTIHWAFSGLLATGLLAASTLHWVELGMVNSMV